MTNVSKGNLRLIRCEGEPRENVVELARDLLKKAESGEIVALGAAYEYADGTAAFWAAHGEHSTPGRLLGEVTLMGHAIAHRMLHGLGKVGQ